MNDFFRTYLDTPIERVGTDCLKWDRVDDWFHGKGLLPAWVADMDLPTVPEVTAAIAERAAHPIYGYTDTTEKDKAAEIGWLDRRYGFRCEPEWILYSPGVVDSLYFSVQAFTQPGDGVLIMTPVYGPFFMAVRDNQRRLIESPLIGEGLDAHMDLDDIEAHLRAGVRLILLCSPHNPLGRCWSREELAALAELADRYSAIVVSDEIHADFTLDGNVHTRFLSLPHAERSVMLTSATKSFNLAGLRQSSIIVPDPELRGKLEKQIALAHASEPNLFGALAQRTAYTCGDAWMDSVCEYIRENRDHALERIRRELPTVKAYAQQATYLMWLDMRASGRTAEQLHDLLVKKAGVALNDGTFFGPSGAGFVRLNLATQRRTLDAVLDRLASVAKEL